MNLGRVVDGRSALAATLLVTSALLTACGAKSGADDSAARAETTASKASRSTVTDSAPVSRGTRGILFIGTSLTAGLGLNPDSAYPQLIQAKIDDAHLPFEVVNAGVSGETSAGLLRRLDWLMQGTFDVVVIETGANDGLRGTSVSAIERNLREIIARIRAAHPTARIVLAQMEAPPNLGTQYTTAFRAMFPRIAAESGATLAPFILDGVAGVKELNQGDGIHPNQRGERIVAENVWKALQPLLK